jgi:hypothetical protein
MQNVLTDSNKNPLPACPLQTRDHGKEEQNELPVA